MSKYILFLFLFASELLVAQETDCQEIYTFIKDSMWRKTDEDIFYVNKKYSIYAFNYKPVKSCLDSIKPEQVKEVFGIPTFEVVHYVTNAKQHFIYYSSEMDHQNEGVLLSPGLVFYFHSKNENNRTFWINPLEYPVDY